MLLTNTLIGKDKKQRAEKARKKLVEEIFSSTVRVPEIEGFLQLKEGFKAKWRKVYVILRASGLYQTLKGKQKVCALFIHCVLPRLPASCHGPCRHPKTSNSWFTLTSVTCTVQSTSRKSSKRQPTFVLLCEYVTLSLSGWKSCHFDLSPVASARRIR